MSVIHRSMLEDFTRIVRLLDVKAKRCISYSQLKRVIKTIDYQQFNSINNRYFAKVLSINSTIWETLDGKELRGSIDVVSGRKRGQNIVNSISHQDSYCRIIGEYDGSKSSEKPIITGYLQEQEDTKCGNFTFDALHTSVQNLSIIHQKQGLYVGQVKKNQRLLLEDCQDVVFYEKALCKKEEIEKGHGRVEKRNYQAYHLNKEDLPKRWQTAGIASLLVVKRSRFTLKTKHESEETSYWISNQLVDNEKFEELSQVIRNHWSIEAHHYDRDVQWGEDKMIMRDKKEALVVASFITLATNLLKNKDSNLSITREKITKNWKNIYSIF